MKRILSACMIGLLLCSAANAAEPPRIAGDDGATYPDLIREQRLVTITLASGAQDFNVKITGFYTDKGTLSILDSTGAPSAYKFDKIREVRVQKDVIRRGEKPDPETVLTADDKKIVDDAANRAMAIFSETHIQPLKMHAANILAASNHENKASATSYLKDLSKSNDAETAMLAAFFLWENGEEIPAEVILTGLNSGSRGAKALAAALVGLTKSNQFIVDVRRLLGDPSIEISPAAAVALGRLADLQSVPKLIEGLSSITEAKAEAAVSALGMFRDAETTHLIEEYLSKAEGLQRFRAVRALYAQGNEHARDLLAKEFINEPAFSRDSALILAQDGDPDSLKFLRAYMTKQWDPNVENLVFRAASAMALYVGGDIQAKGTIADILNTKPNDIYAPGKTSDQKFKEQSVIQVQSLVCVLMGLSMRRDMLPILSGPIQNTEPAVALDACRAAVQIGNREFGKRIKEALEGR